MIAGIAYAEPSSLYSVFNASVFSSTPVRVFQAETKPLISGVAYAPPLNIGGVFNVLNFSAFSADTTAGEGGGPFLPLTGGDMTGNIIMAGSSAMETKSVIFDTISGTGKTNLTGSSTGSANVIFRLPNAEPVSSGYVLSSDTSGNMSWAPNGGSGTFLPLAGGTMSGDIAMGDHNIVNTSSVTIVNQDLSGTVKLQGPVTTTTSSVVLSLPNSYPGANGYVLASDTSGFTSWAPNGGSGVYLPLTGGTMSGSIRFPATLSGGSVTIIAPASLFNNRSFYLPNTDPVNGYVLQTDGGGHTSWVDPGLTNGLPLSGGTMQGSIDMNGYNIIGLSSVLVDAIVSFTSQAHDGNTVLRGPASNGGNNYIYSLPSAFPANGWLLSCNSVGTMSWVNPNSVGDLPVSGGTMSGDITMANHNIVNAGTLGVLNQDAGGSVQLRGPATTATSSITFSLPNAYPASSGYVLASTTAGAMSWIPGSAGVYLPLAGGTMSGDINMGTSLLTSLFQRFPASVGGGSLTVYAPPIMSTNNVLTLPSTAPVNGYILQTDGSGNTSWVDPGSVGDLPLTGGRMQGTIDMNGHIVQAASSVSINLNLVMRSQASDGYTILTGPPSAGFNNWTYSLPSTYPTSGWVLSSDNTGFMSWVPNGGSGVYLPLSGGTMAGNINMGANNITNGGTLACGAITSGVISNRASVNVDGFDPLSSATFFASTISGGFNGSTVSIGTSATVVEVFPVSARGGNYLVTLSNFSTPGPVATDIWSVFIDGSGAIITSTFVNATTGVSLLVSSFSGSTLSFARASGAQNYMVSLMRTM